MSSSGAVEGTVQICSDYVCQSVLSKVLFKELQTLALDFSFPFQLSI